MMALNRQAIRRLSLQPNSLRPSNLRPSKRLHSSLPRNSLRSLRRLTHRSNRPRKVAMLFRHRSHHKPQRRRPTIQCRHLLRSNRLCKRLSSPMLAPQTQACSRKWRKQANHRKCHQI